MIALLDRALRHTTLRHIRVRDVIPPGETDTTLAFVGSTNDSGGGVNADSAATDAEQQFSFTTIAVRTGFPEDLEISEGGVLKLVVTYPSDYEGQSFTYTETDGTVHGGTFPVGGGTVNY